MCDTKMRQEGLFQESANRTNQMLIGSRQSDRNRFVIPLITTTDLDEVIGFIEIMGRFEHPINYSDFDRIFGRGNVSDYSSIAITSGQLGLVERTPRGFVLTDLGLGFLKANGAVKKEILRARLYKTEPFMTAILLLKRKGSISALEISKGLQRKYPNLAPMFSDTDKLEKILVEWGLSTEMLEFIAGTGSFKENRKTESVLQMESEK